MHCRSRETQMGQRPGRYHLKCSLDGGTVILSFSKQSPVTGNVIAGTNFSI